MTSCVSAIHPYLMLTAFQNVTGSRTRGSLAKMAGISSATFGFGKNRKRDYSDVDGGGMRRINLRFESNRHPTISRTEIKAEIFVLAKSVAGL